MTIRQLRRVLGLAVLAVLVGAVLLDAARAGGSVRCPDGEWRAYGTCPGPAGPAGPPGRTGPVLAHWAAMAAAAASIPHADRHILSVGAGAGAMDGVSAVAVGIAVRVTDHTRIGATLMRSDDEAGVMFGVARGFR